MTIKTVVLLGADGKLGPEILHALLRHSFIVTVLKRATSRSPDTYPSDVKVARVADDFPEAELLSILQGQDAVVVSTMGLQVEVQERIANAAERAGVSRFIPPDFGSCDSASPATQALVPLYKHKSEMRNHLQALAERSNGAFTWTALVPGHFFDWKPQFLHIFLKEKRADVLDDGETRFSVSTLERIGEATARILIKEEETKNKTVYVQSFCVSQNQILAAYERQTGGKWKVRRYDSNKWRDEHKAKADAGDLDAVEECVWYLGTVDANWESRDTFAMNLLGLEDQNLDEVVEMVVKRFG